jgi:hypothetical protein
MDTLHVMNTTEKFHVHNIDKKKSNTEWYTHNNNNDKQCIYYATT